MVSGWWGKGAPSTIKSVYPLIDKNDEAALIQLDTVLANAPFHSDALKLKALMLLQQDNKTAAARVYQTYPARQTALLYLASG